MTYKKTSRREFLKKAAAGTLAFSAFPMIVPGTVFGKNGRPAPSDMVTMACIGVGWQGTSNLNSFLREDGVRIIAVCDVDTNHLANAKNLVDKKYGNKDCETYADFREVLARKDIDSVSLGLPDHWHSIPAIMAAEAGKDIYGEKPLSHSLHEGRAMVNAVERYGRIWQTGSWQRSQTNFRRGAELVRNGRIGKIHTVEVGLPSGHSDFAGSAGQDDITIPPKELNYEMWLGPAPYKPYIKSRSHKNWRWDLDFGGGQLMDWVGHHVDIAHWGMDTEYTGPVEIEGHGDYPKTGVYNSATKYKVHTKYKNGIVMIIAGGYPEIRQGTRWIGDKGWIYVNRGNTLEASDKQILREQIGPEEIHLYKSPGHWRNFIDCVKSRKTTITPCEVAHRSASPGHLGQIAMILGRKLYFDPDTEEILNDEEAGRMLGNAMRSPWHLG